MAVTNEALTREVLELIAALDSRVPQVERAGELSIARDARALRAKAVARLAELAGQNVADLDVAGRAPQQDAQRT